MLDKKRELLFLRKCREKIQLYMELWLEIPHDEYELIFDYVFEDKEHSPVCFVRLDIPRSPNLSDICFLCTENTDNSVKLEWLESYS